jgi:hypothetical protein
MPLPSGSTRRSWQLPVVLATLASALFVLGATSRGVGLSPDSLQYVTASESAASGNGLITVGWEGVPAPLTHFPPGYPLLLAAATRAGLPPQQFARWSNVVLFVLTIVVAAVLARRMAPQAPWAAPIAACTAAVAHDLVVAHSMVWTEPLYLTLSLGGALALGMALDRHSPVLLTVAGAAAAAAALTRYVGVANIGMVAIAVLLWWPASHWRRLLVSSAVSALAATPLFLALALQAGASDGAIANRRFVWHPIEGADLRVAASVATKWVTPLSDATYLTAVWAAVLVVLLGVVLTLRSRPAQPAIESSESSRMQSLILLLYAAMYMAVVVLSMSLVDAQTTLEARLLVPILVVVIIYGAVGLARLAMRGGIVRLVTCAMLALILGANLMRMLPWLREAHRHGLALNRIDRAAQRLVEATRRLPASAQLYSNDPYFVRVQTERIVLGVPRARDPNSMLPNAHHAQQVQAICDSAAARPTFLVLFDKPMSSDSTARADTAARSGEVERMQGGAMIKVRPGCRS